MSADPGVLGDWTEDAMCRGLGWVMYPVDGLREDRFRTGSRRPSRMDADRYDLARAVCAQCPVADECAVGMAHDVYGVRAGLAPHERCAKPQTRGDLMRARLAIVDDGRDADQIAALVGCNPRTVWRHRQLRLGEEPADAQA